MAARIAGMARMPKPTAAARATPSSVALMAPARAGRTRWRAIRIVSKMRVRGWSRRARIASDAIVAAQCGQLVAEGLGVSEGETRDADGAPHPAGGVDDDAGEAESSLEGTLARVDVLDAGMRDDAGGAPEHAALYDEVVVADGEAPGTVARPRQERSGRAA